MSKDIAAEIEKEYGKITFKEQTRVFDSKEKQEDLVNYCNFTS